MFVPNKMLNVSELKLGDLSYPDGPNDTEDLHKLTANIEGHDLELPDNPASYRLLLITLLLKSGRPDFLHLNGERQDGADLMLASLLRKGCGSHARAQRRDENKILNILPPDLIADWVKLDETMKEKGRKNEHSMLARLALKRYREIQIAKKNSWYCQE